MVFECPPELKLDEFMEPVGELHQVCQKWGRIDQARRIFLKSQRHLLNLEKKNEPVAPVVTPATAKPVPESAVAPEVIAVPPAAKGQDTDSDQAVFSKRTVFALPICDDKKFKAHSRRPDTGLIPLHVNTGARFH